MSNRPAAISVILLLAILLFTYRQQTTFTVHRAAVHDVSPPLASLRDSGTAPSSSDCDDCGTSPPDPDEPQDSPPAQTAPAPPLSPASAAVEQRSQGARPPAALIESFDGLGLGFEGPQGAFTGRNPSDNSLAI